MNLLDSSQLTTQCKLLQPIFADGLQQGVAGLSGGLVYRRGHRNEQTLIQQLCQSINRGEWRAFGDLDSAETSA